MRFVPTLLVSLAATSAGAQAQTDCAAVQPDSTAVQPDSTAVQPDSTAATPRWTWGVAPLAVTFVLPLGKHGLCPTILNE